MDGEILLNENNTTTLVTNVEVENHSHSGSSRWQFFGQTFPRSEIVFIVQVVLVYIVVIVSIVNLSIENNKNDKLWITLLSSAIGYILPSPSLKLTRT